MGKRYVTIDAEHYEQIRYALMHMADVSTEMLEHATEELDTIICDEDRESWIEIVMELDNSYKRITREK